MSGRPPPPRKPPAAKPPVPQQPGGKPPVPPKPGGYGPPQYENGGSSAGRIIGIIAAIVGAFLLLGLSCGGCILFRFYEAKQQFDREFDQEVQRQLEEEQQREATAEMAALARLEEPLMERAKADVPLHWAQPEGLRRKRWNNWIVRKVSEDVFEISGKLELSFRAVAPSSHTWACEYTTNDPPGPRADWTLQRVTFDGQQQFP